MDEQALGLARNRAPAVAAVEGGDGRCAGIILVRVFLDRFQDDHIGKELTFLDSQGSRPRHAVGAAGRLTGRAVGRRSIHHDVASSGRFVVSAVPWRLNASLEDTRRLLSGRW